MAKFRRYRNYNRRNRSRWSPNIQEILTTTLQTAADSFFYHDITLAFNPNQSNSTVSQVFTVKNVECNFYIDSSSIVNQLEDFCAYIMFVPQGMNVNYNYNLLHPEYIMAYKYLGSPTYETNSSTQQYQPYRVKTRLSRKLQTGDRIVLFIRGNNVGNANTEFDLHGLVRWWTRAN